jgi:hypothetical protein
MSPFNPVASRTYTEYMDRCSFFSGEIQSLTLVLAVYLDMVVMFKCCLSKVQQENIQMTDFSSVNIYKVLEIM